MKHIDGDLLVLQALCKQLDVEISAEEARNLIEYLDQLLEANQRINLTRITDRGAAIRLHLVDSLAAAPEVRAATPGPLCDIGTGGGFPGVPLALVSARPAVLLDSVGKKAAAVDALLRDCIWASDMHAVAARAEQHAREHASRYAVVTARAVAPLPSLVELAAPLLKQSGVLVALKGAPTRDELDAGDRAASKVGMRRVGLRELVLPEGNEHRVIVTYQRFGKPKIALPRREGLAQHSPLG